MREQRSGRFALATRAGGYALLWLLLMPSRDPADLAFGALAVVAATALSLRLFPPAAGEVRLVGLALLMPHLLWQSILAGVDVARRAFTPRMPLDPGFLACPLALPEGLARDSFATFTSMMPGTLPCGEKDGVPIYHCLDVRQPIADVLRAEAGLFLRVVTRGGAHG
jgi:multicomponent Na+:H+ antiporter subunit E